MQANQRQEGGSHYGGGDAVGTCPNCHCEIQHWDWAHNLRGLEYAATKYLARWHDKGGLESLKKAIHYTQKLIEVNFPGTSVSVVYGQSPGAEAGGRDKKPAEIWPDPIPDISGVQACGGQSMAVGKAAHPYQRIPVEE